MMKAVVNTTNARETKDSVQPPKKLHIYCAQQLFVFASAQNQILIFVFHSLYYSIYFCSTDPPCMHETCINLLTVFIGTIL